MNREIFKVGLEEFQKEIDKIADDRLEYGYDSICLRIDQLVNELAHYASISPEARTSGRDYNYYKMYYNNRAVRIFQILDDLMDGKGHSSIERLREKNK